MSISKIAIPETDENVDVIALAEFGDAENARHRDLARDLLRGYGRDRAKLLTQGLLAGLVSEAEDVEAERLAELRAATARSVEFREKLDSERAARYEPPEGFKDILLRTFNGQPMKLRVPIDWIIPV